MRAILALAVGLFATSTALADDYNYDWLLNNMAEVKVDGSQKIGLIPMAGLGDVFKKISEIEEEKIRDLIDVDYCVRDHEGHGAKMQSSYSGCIFA